MFPFLATLLELLVPAEPLLVFFFATREEGCLFSTLSEKRDWEKEERRTMREREREREERASGRKCRTIVVAEKSTVDWF